MHEVQSKVGGLASRGTLSEISFQWLLIITGEVLGPWASPRAMEIEDLQCPL